MGGGPDEGPERRKEYMVLISPFPKLEGMAKVLDRISSKHPNIEIDFVHNDLSAANAWRGDDIDWSKYKKIDILGTLFSLPPNASKTFPGLQLLHLFSAGSNQIANSDVYKNMETTITTSSGVHGPQISEWVIMTALIQSHKYNKLHDLQKQHKWGGDYSKHVNELHDFVGMRIGILGYGSIGRQAGRVFKAMGADILAYTATPKDDEEAKKDKGFLIPGTGDPDGEIPVGWYSGLGKEQLHTFLRQDLDLLLISVPLTKETMHFIGKAEFEILKHKKTFVANIARGQIVDQEALIQALKDGWIRGAALDVTDPEPLPADSPLWDMENVTITPHISGIGSKYSERTLMILEQNLDRRAKGERLLNVVDRKRGY